MKKIKNGIEHALELQVKEMTLISSNVIYDDEKINKIRSNGKFHIYIIGMITDVYLNRSFLDGSNFFIEACVSGESKTISFVMPGIAKEVKTEDEIYYEIDGERWFPSLEDICDKLNVNKKNGTFKVLYIGQSYGTSGSRDVFDRLKKHETLQKIALSGIPAHHLYILLLDVNNCGGVVTIMNPNAENQAENDARINNGIYKIKNTTDEEVISIFEACMIKYFNPEFNHIFANSFPSTNLKILSECYKKDFSFVSSEINTSRFNEEEIDIELFSNQVDPGKIHTANFHLHKDEDRRAFFFVDAMKI